MKSYLGDAIYTINQPAKVGILLTNLGTPDAPTPAALRRYLGEFLADPRITELPRWLWWWVLHGVILRIRPRRSAHNYKKVWTAKGSPLLNISYAQTQALQQRIVQEFTSPITVALGMRYGNPSIAHALEQLRQANAQRIIILPLYPQYSSASTGSTFDAIGAVLQQWRWIPEIRFINDYHSHPAYIQALVSKIQDYWAEHGRPDKLIFSFHGIPKRFAQAGDPYEYQCCTTAHLVIEQLQLTESQWQITFQSRFGREAWLQPYTDETLIALGCVGTARVDVVCPGFAADCLETLEETDIQNRKLFLQAGGQAFHYIPALNESSVHIDALLAVIKQHGQGLLT